MTSDLKEMQDEVLRGIGRNVLNLQKMEGILKRLVVLVNLSVPVNNIEKTVRKREKEVSRKTLGPLIDEFVRSIHPDLANERQQNDSDDAMAMELSIWFEDPSFVEELKESLKKISKERNDLIHKKLLAFKPKSIESCRTLAGELEDQRQRIKPQFETLASIWIGLRKHLTDVMDELDSADT